MTKQTTEAAAETAETKKISLPEEETEALLAQIDTAFRVIISPSLEVQGLGTTTGPACCLVGTSR